MTKKPPSGLAASGHADDADPEQITKEHNEDGQEGEGQSINIDPSEDVTVEAAEDVTTEAADRTPHPSLRPGAADGTPGPRAPTLLGVPIQSLPLPGVTAASLNDDETRTIDYDEEITVLAQAEPAPASKAAATNLYDLDDSLGPSIVDDDEEETKVEPAESAMKAAESIDDVTTALSAQASLEREKALRRSVAAPVSSAEDDLEFADPEAEDQEDEEQEEEEESLDDELSDEDEVISAGGAGAVEDDDDIDDVDDDAHDGAPTATFMKPADSTGLSGLLNPRRPPTGAPFGRDGFGSRLPTPYAVAASAASTAPAPSTSPFASRLGPAPIGSPYGARATGTAIPAIQVPPPSGAATTASGSDFFSRKVQVPAGGLILLIGGCLLAGFGLRGLTSKSTPAAPTTIVAKPTATPAAPAAPVVEPVAGSTPVAPTEPKAAIPTTEPVKAPAGEAPGLAQAGTDPAVANPDPGLLKPAKKPAAPRPHKPAIDTASEEAVLKPAAASKPAAAPKPAIATTPKPAVAAAPKPAAAPKAPKKPAKAWVDPFAQ